MAGLIQQVYVNAVRYGFQDISMQGETSQQYGQVPFLIPKGALGSFNWEAAQEHGEVDGNRVQSMGVTRGQGRAQGDFELLDAESDDFVKTITLGGQFSLMDVFFNVRLRHAVNGGVLGQDVRVVEVIGMMIKRVSAGNQKGADAATQRYEYRAGQVFVNGVAMYADPAT
jgi:hypothetical protein